MATKVSYSYARQNLASLLDQTEDDQEPVYISRRDHEDMVLLPAAEYRSVKETAQLLRSPENARRLLRALQRALESEVAPRTLSELRSEVGLQEIEG
ncbi:MAG: type II toxin-antitoxin system prevent-host-death family antitoxin [Gemmatimonadota bacterium]